MARLEELVVEIRADLSGFERTLQAAGRQLRDFGQTVGRVGGGDLDLNIQPFTRAVDRAEANLRDLSGRMPEITVTADTSQAERALDGIETHAREIDSLTSDLDLGGLAGAAAGVLTLGGATAFIFDQFGRATEIQNLAQQLGTSVGQMTKLDAVMRSVGGETEELVEGLGDMLNTLSKEGPGGELAQKLDKLGVATHDANDQLLDGVDIAFDLADALNEMDAAMARNVVSALLGEEGWREFSRVLAQTEGPLSGVVQRLEDMGVVLSPADVELFGKLASSFRQLLGVSAALGVELLRSLGPGLQAVLVGATGIARSLVPAARAMGDFATGISVAVRQSEALQRTLIVLGGLVAGAAVGGALITLGKLIVTLSRAFGLLNRRALIVVGAFSAIAGAIALIKGKDIADAFKIMTDALGITGADLESVQQELQNVLSQFEAGAGAAGATAGGNLREQLMQQLDDLGTVAIRDIAFTTDVARRLQEQLAAVQQQLPDLRIDARLEAAEARDLFPAEGLDTAPVESVRSYVQALTEAARAQGAVNRAVERERVIREQIDRLREAGVEAPGRSSRLAGGAIAAGGAAIARSLHELAETELPQTFRTLFDSLEENLVSVGSEFVLSVGDLVSNQLAATGNFIGAGLAQAASGIISGIVDWVADLVGFGDDEQDLPRARSATEFRETAARNARIALQEIQALSQAIATVTRHLDSEFISPIQETHLKRTLEDLESQLAGLKDTGQQLNETFQDMVRNMPSGFRVPLAIFEATRPGLGGPALPGKFSGAAVAAQTQTTNINLGPGSIVVNGQVAGDDLLREIERAARQREARGGGSVRFSRRFGPG